MLTRGAVAKKRFHHLSGTILAGADDQTAPAALRLESIGIAAQEARYIGIATKCCRSGKTQFCAGVYKDRDHVGCAQQRGMIERREPGFIKALQIRTQFQQYPQRRRLTMDNGQVRRHASHPGTVHPAFQIVRPPGDEAANALDISHRHG